jgi:hypothetical protein
MASDTLSFLILLSNYLVISQQDFLFFLQLFLQFFSLQPFQLFLTLLHVSSLPINEGIDFLLSASLMVCLD